MENIYYYEEKYRCDKALYLPPILSNAYCNIIDRSVGAPDRGWGVLGNLNATEKKSYPC